MSQSFLSDLVLSSATWQAFERLVSRLLLVSGFDSVMVVGQSGDGGADVLARRNHRRWLVQVKRWTSPVGTDVVAKTLEACARYGADVPVIVSRSGFEASVFQLQNTLARQGVQLQLWDRVALAKRRDALHQAHPALDAPTLREYQEEAVSGILSRWLTGSDRSALVVLATGLGKTVVAYEAFRRASKHKPELRLLVLAHRNELVYQLERSFWPGLRLDQASVVWNGQEKPDPEALASAAAVFACVDSVAAAVEAGRSLPKFDFVVVDECHHLGTTMYERTLDALEVGEPKGPFLLGLTATPWRPDGSTLDHRFDGPLVSVDLVEGLRRGFLANVDYRMFTDNVDWDSLRRLHGSRFTPRAINRTLFIDDWDDAVVERLAEAWLELSVPRCIAFCGTVAHAERMAARINSLAFTRAEPIYSRSSAGVSMPVVDRHRLLCDFADGKVGVLCAVEVLNEGVDVPDVNLVVFQRVTHSRRIFVQQLGRGLRLAPGKDKVIVLDFVSDVRRFAAGLDLERGLGEGPRPGHPVRVALPSKVTFMRAGSEDVEGAAFLGTWLGDLEAVEEAGEDVSVLRFPPLADVPTITRRV